MTRYVVIGAGAIGATLAAQLHLAGIDAVLVARGENLTSIRSRGLTVRRPAITETVPVAVVGSPDELELRHDDVLVLATKTQDAEAVLSTWAWLPVLDADGEATLLGADLPILTFQNGLSTEDLALRRFARVYGVSIGIAASYLSPGEVVSPSYPTVGVAWLGRYPRADDEQERYVADLVNAGYDVRSVDDIRAWKARKLLGNVVNGLDVLDATDAERAEARKLVIAEATAVLAAAGVAVPDAAAVTAAGGDGFSLTVEPVPGHTLGRLSTWQSFARGASSEVDYLNGEVVLAARLARVDAPLNERLQRLLGAESRDAAAPGRVPIAELYAAGPALAPASSAAPGVAAAALT
ncbi:MAG: ketopantoate reductase ApbA/PanE [Subtercola sp.]|nr:ketopantoate reductase ApbA/PanE [Subtercola sp.]